MLKVVAGEHLDKNKFCKYTENDRGVEAVYETTFLYSRIFNPTTTACRQVTMKRTVCTMEEKAKLHKENAEHHCCVIH